MQACRGVRDFECCSGWPAHMPAHLVYKPRTEGATWRYFNYSPEAAKAQAATRRLVPPASTACVQYPHHTSVAWGAGEAQTDLI